MIACYLSLGSNLGDRKALLEKALGLLGERAGKLKKISSLYETEPVGMLDQPWFLNCCVALETTLSAEDLLRTCQMLETELGRTRSVPEGPRTIDLDILFYGEHRMQTAELTLPHPELAKRRFVLVPLAQIAPLCTQAAFQKTVWELLKECPDTSIVRPYDNV